MINISYKQVKDTYRTNNMALNKVKDDMEMVIKSNLTKEQLNDMGLTKRQWKRNNKEFYIYRYIKDKLTKDSLQTLGLFRSIVVLDDKVVSFAPPKSIDCETFIENNNLEDTILEEFIDGTMINLFYIEGLNDSELGDWEIATRSFVGGDFSFYFNPDNPKTFRKMFIEALEASNIDLSILDKNYCYSFVLQHPNNRIVTPNEKAGVCLTDVYSINGFDISKVDKDNFVDKLPMPKRYNITEFSSYEEIYDKFTSTKKEDFKLMGCVLSNGEDRSKIRNPAYEVVRELRGNQPKLQFTYLELRRKSKNSVLEYLEYYPEHRVMFNKFNNQVKRFCDNLFDNYHFTHVKRVKKHKDLEHQFKPHVYYLHNEFLNILKNNGDIITHQYVNNYVNKLESAKLMYALNYSFRPQRNTKNESVDEVLDEVVDEVVNEIVDDVVNDVLNDAVY